MWFQIHSSITENLNFQTQEKPDVEERIEEPKVEREKVHHREGPGGFPSCHLHLHLSRTKLSFLSALKFSHTLQYSWTSPNIIYTKLLVCLNCVPGGSDGKDSACNAGDLGLIPGLGRYLGGGTTHSSILAWRIPMDRGAWRATVHGVTKDQTWLSD